MGWVTGRGGLCPVRLLGVVADTVVGLVAGVSGVWLVESVVRVVVMLRGPDTQPQEVRATGVLAGPGCVVRQGLFKR